MRKKIETHIMGRGEKRVSLSLILIKNANKKNIKFYIIWI